MAMKNTEIEIHELTRAEIARQVGALSERRNRIIQDRADIYASRTKNGLPSPAYTVDETAARAIAKRLLNGAAPESLSAPLETGDRDILLSREQRGIEIASKILNDKAMAASAAEAVIWGEENRKRWRSLCNQMALAAVRMDALERSMQALIESCPDPFAVRLPLANTVSRPISDTPVREWVENAPAEDVINRSEVEKAMHVG
jgi:hypothetical protein